MDEMKMQSSSDGEGECGDDSDSIDWDRIPIASDDSIELKKKIRFDFRPKIESVAVQTGRSLVVNIHS